jgi:hypothetical protein
MDRFEVVDEIELSENDYMGDDSDDDDIDMKELVGATGGNLDEDEYNNQDGVINDEIEDIDSDEEEENAQIAAMEMKKVQDQKQFNKMQKMGVPGLSLGGLGKGPDNGMTGKPSFGLNLGGMGNNNIP